jgi:hypothetical protein
MTRKPPSQPLEFFGSPNLPEMGKFSLTLCVTREELELLMSAAMEYCYRNIGEFDSKTYLPLLQAVNYLQNPSANPCLDIEGGGCLEFPAYASFIKYYPDNPFDSDDSPAPGYLLPAWQVWGNIETILPDFIDDFINHNINQFTGYRDNDAICWISSLLSFNWLSWLESGYFYPAVEIEVSGKGQANIAFLSFPLGSRAIIQVDEPPNMLDFLTGGVLSPAAIVADTARDVLSFPPEGTPEFVVSVEIPEEGDHTIYVWFSPVVDFEISEDILGFGGGIRSVELCGGLRPRNTPPPPPPPDLEGVTELRPEFQFTVDCGLEYQLRNQNGDIVQNWQPVPGWDENAALCFGGGMTLSIEDICEAIVCGGNELARQLLRGVRDNLAPGGSIEIGNDGEVIVKAPGAPPNDETTTSDEEAASGGSTAVRLGINTIWSNLNSWYGAGVSAADAKTRLKLIYTLFSEGADNLVDAYYGARAASQPYPTSFASTLDGYLYCKGNYKPTIAEWIYEVHTANQQSVAATIVNALTQEQLQLWYNQGKVVPNTDYITYSCVPVDTEIFTMDAAYLQSSTYKTGTVVHKTNHLIELKVSGKVLHPSDGSYQDFFYHVASNGTKTFLGPATSQGTVQFNSPFSNPTTAKVPWKSSGEYKVTMLVTSAAAANFRRAISAANMVAGAAGFTVTLKDLGEVVS